MEYDEVFDHVGAFGMYQFLLYMVIGLASLSASLQNININFVGAYQDHWCLVPRLQNFSHDTQKFVSIPFDDNNEYDTCRVYNYPFHNLTDEEILTWNRTELAGYKTMDCSEWVFDQSEFVSTVNSEFELVCDKSWLNQLASTVFMLGMFVGSITSGIVSDRIGRYKTCVIGLSANFLVSIVSPFVPGYATFAVVRFLRATTTSWAYLAGFIVLMEFMGPAYRVSLGVLYQVFFSVGFMVVTGMAYAIRDFRKLQLAISLSQLSLGIIAFVLPESPRWLLSRGRVSETEALVRKMAAVNRRTLPKDFTLDTNSGIKSDKTSGRSIVSDDGPSEGNFFAICKSPILRNEICIVYLNWFTASMTYYGLSLNAGAFGDVFTNTFLSGVIEIPANLLCVLCLEKGGRRYSNAAALLVGGAFCLACIPVILVNPDRTNVLTTLSTIGKGAVTFTFSGIYVYTAEMFHTPVRHLAVGSASTFSRIGSMISPYIGGPLANIWAPMPTMIFGVLTLGTGIVCFFLPETKGYSLPDTLADAEDIGKGRNRPTRKGATIRQVALDNAFPEQQKELIGGVSDTITNGQIKEDTFENAAYLQSHNAIENTTKV